MHLADPLGQAERAGAEHLPVVDLLEGLAVALVARDLADEQDHRRRVLERGVHADRGVGRARAARHEADARPAGELALRLGHEGRAALLPAGDEADALAVLVEAVEHGEEALAGHAEDGVDALRDQRFDEGVAGEACGVMGHGVTAASARRAIIAHGARRRSGFAPMPLIHRLVNYPRMASRTAAVVEVRSRDADRSPRGDPARGDGDEFAEPRPRRRAHGRASPSAPASTSGSSTTTSPSKDELFLAVLEQTYADIRAAEQRAAPRGEPTRSRRSAAWSPSPGTTTSSTRSSSPCSTARTCTARGHLQALAAASAR